ncbi:ferric iron reductase [Umezakia ovalisporum]|jgi:ferric iron reductase protein FhuF|uniref:Ferric iron reductase n=2 Tax=Umezakia ovalisporum TaxID=75695 RepID=A0AA43H1P4_9CYAN|nr:ferric iron reductase [Umezakia ovalisporum]MDH6056212.1 ferric iron reductase [Umezakia ovalisporum FSS-43]MDH6065634.1 ferric iron reductase [Umezakia ovalisporum FSS-62]MDH6072095.1 ferric iron reductase [Umezakia ovalisporum CobakiLakeA]MDH6073988.1 ferric iron reductase [Umezakia ovalisporum CS-1034]MDH6083065.1 ferric iron reductase [Umezakia ovalisporum FSS-44]
MIVDSKNIQTLSTSQEIANNMLDFLLKIFTLAQINLDSFYTDLIILTHPPDGVEVISVNDYLQPDRLLSQWQTSDIYQKSQDLRIAASIWNKVYSWKTLPGVLALMTWAGIGLNSEIDNVSFVLEDGEPKALWFHDLSGTVIYPPRLPIPIPQDYPGKIVDSVENLHKAVFTSLFQCNFAPMIERVHSLTKLSKKTMWGNAVNASERQFAEISKCTNSESIKTDYLVLYEQRNNSVMPRPNPLYNLVRTEQINEPGLPATTTVRLTCCLYALIPPYDQKCTNCPLLKPQERIAQMKKYMTEPD